MKYYVGIDIGGTRMKLGIVDQDGNIVVQENQATKKDKVDIFNQISTFINTHSYTIKGVGISTPGIVREDGYMQTSGAIKCFLHGSLKEELESHLGLPVCVENDAKSAAMAEKWIGATKEVSDFVCITLGTAVGGAIYQNGQLQRGLGGLAGELGVVLVGLDKKDYREQSFSYHAATVAGLCRHYSHAKKERVLDAKEIMKRAKQGDILAKDCLEDFYHAVAVLCVNVTAMIAPKIIIIGGGISANQEAMEAIIKSYQEIQENYHVLSMVEVPIIQSCHLKNEAGMIGAVHSFITRNNL